MHLESRRHGTGQIAVTWDTWLAAACLLAILPGNEPVHFAHPPLTAANRTDRHVSKARESGRRFLRRSALSILVSVTQAVYATEIAAQRSG
jgi:hypothetical protein